MTSTFSAFMAETPIQRDSARLIPVRRSRSPRYQGGGPSPKAGMWISPTPFLEVGVNYSPLECPPSNNLTNLVSILGPGLPDEFGSAPPSNKAFARRIHGN